MKKILFLTALLCASVTGFALDSEYCGGDVMATGNNQAAFRWQTTEDGAITINIIEVLGGATTDTHFRNDGISLSKIKVGGADASTYFNHACTGTKQQIVLSLKDPSNAPALGTKITVTSQVVEYATSKNGDAWPTLSFEYTYGGVCSSESVLTRLYFSASAHYTKLNTGVTLTVVPTDQMGNILDDDIEYSISPADAGSITNDVYTPTKEGVVTITASVGGLSSSVTITGEPTDNIALNKNCEAGYEPADSREVSTKAIDGDISTQWVTWANRSASEEWMYVDLGTKYNISALDVLWGDDVPTSYILQIRANAPTTAQKSDDTAWENVVDTIKTVTANSEQYFKLTKDSVARYVRIHSLAKSGQCIRLKELRVYGTEWADDSDTEKPVMVSATVDSKTYNSIVLAVSATDNHEVDVYHVVDAGNSIDINLAPAAGKITINGLTELTTYNFTITAIDGAGNESDNSVVVENEKTPYNPAIPQATAPVPSGTGKTVRPIYSEAFSSILAHSFDKAGFEGARGYTKTINGDEFIIYEVTSSAIKGGSIGMYNDGADAIIAADGYHSESYKGVDASSMEYLHIDIWALQANDNINICINDQALSTLKLEHDGEGWNSFDIELSEFNVSSDVDKRIDNVRWFKFNGFNSNTVNFAVDNIYFYKEDGSATAIDNTNADAKAVKVIENGQLVIIKNGVKYNVAGQQVK